MEIKFYEDQAGRIPVREFLDSLDIKMRQKNASLCAGVAGYGRFFAYAALRVIRWWDF